MRKDHKQARKYLRAAARMGNEEAQMIVERISCHKR
jgi:TPR repeat protein